MRAIRIAFAVGAVSAAFSAAAPVANAQVAFNINGNGHSFTENFNTLAVSGSNNNSSSIPIPWAFSEAGTGNNVTYAASDGSSATANTYSFGTGTNTDRAFGEITGSLQSTLGAVWRNNTGAPITGMVVGYTGEEWRLDASTIDKLDFQFSLTATALNSGTYTDVNALDFSTPSTVTPGAKNGNSAANRTVLGPFFVQFASPLQHGGTVFLRWVPLNLAGANDGLAIDDFSVSFVQPDRDGDGVADSVDNCPDDFNPRPAPGAQADQDGDGTGDTCDGDIDGDGDLNTADNCDFDANADQANLDGDALGDVCDSDVDGDGVLNAADNCPRTSNASQANGDGDGAGDACDPLTPAATPTTPTPTTPVKHKKKKKKKKKRSISR
jgi:hypothetical protein